jgi:nucleotide-binding universal stress UspA family protein
MRAERTVVAAIDFSDNAKDAVDTARELVRGVPGRIHLLHVVPDPLHTPWLVEGMGVDFAQLQARWIADAEQELVVFAAAQELDPLTVTTAIAVGTPATEIVNYARAHDADLVVLGTHGRGAISRFMLGSVAERVIRQAPCAVLVVPHRTMRAKPDERAMGVAS